MQCLCTLLYCHLCPTSLYKFVSTLSDTRHNFLKNVLDHEMCILIFSSTFDWHISHSKKKWARYNKKCILVFMYSNCHSCQTLMKLEYSQHIFKKYLTIKYHKNLSSGSWVVPCRRTDRYDEANSHVSQICKHA